MKFDHIKLNEIFFLMVVLSCLMSVKHLVVVKLKLNVKLLVIVLSCLLSHVKCEHL